LVIVSEISVSGSETYLVVIAYGQFSGSFNFGIQKYEKMKFC